MNFWPSSFLTFGCFVGIDEHHAVLVEQPLVAFDERCRASPRFLKLSHVPRSARMYAFSRRRGVERGAHARARLAIPRALRGRRCRRLRPSTSAARRHACRSCRRAKRTAPSHQRSAFNAAVMSLPPFDVRRIRLRADEDEVVVHDRVTLDAFAFGEPFQLRRLVVDEHDVGIAAATDVERLARTDGDDAHVDARVLLERRQQLREQAGLLGRRRRRDDDERLLRERRRGKQRARDASPAISQQRSSSQSLSFEERPAVGRARFTKKVAAAVCSATRPPCSRTTLSARRFACADGASSSRSSCRAHGCR